MKDLKNYVLDVNQVRHLEALGYEIKDSLFALTLVYDGVDYGFEYFNEVKYKSFLDGEGTCYDNYTPTLTLQEILEILPWRITVDGVDYNLHIEMDTNLLTYRHREGNTIDKRLYSVNGMMMTTIEAAFNMLCWVVEKGYKCRH